MIEVKHLWKSYGQHVAARDVSFEIPTGTIAGFLGPNGAGKSTCMRVLTTFHPLDHGCARVAGHDVMREPKQVCAKTGYLPESMPIHPELRVVEYLRFRGALKGLRGKQLSHRTDEVMRRCQIDRESKKLLSALSKGYRQRVGLADALLTDPEILILDEPTSGLDPRQVTEVRSLIESFKGERTVLLSSHILGEVEQVCERVIIIDGGVIRAQETRESWKRRLEDSQRLELLLKDPPADASRKLEQLPGVREVQAEGGRFTLWVRGDQRLAVFECAKREQWSLLELAEREATLESLFLQVTAPEESAA